MKRLVVALLVTAGCAGAEPAFEDDTAPLGADASVGETDASRPADVDAGARPDASAVDARAEASTPPGDGGLDAGPEAGSPTGTLARCEACGTGTCKTGLSCANFGVGSVCVPSCGGDAGAVCPAGFRCVAAGVCAPIANVCCASTGPASADAGVTDVCNGADDDCDGVVDRGCPRSAALEGSTPSAVTGSANYGAVFGDLCGAGRALVGFDFATSATRLVRLAPVCAEIYFDEAQGAVESAYRLRTRNAVVLAPHGGLGGTLYQDRCGAGEIVTALVGKSGDDIDAVGFRCASVAFARGEAGGAFAPVFTPGAASPLRGGSGGGAFDLACPAGSVAVALEGRADGVLHMLSLRCATVTLMLR